jgi:hypothetical protein
VPLPRRLKPSPNLRRKLGEALAFTILGLVACASGALLLVGDHGPDPRSAFALAPLQSPGRETATPTATAEMPAVIGVLAQQVTKADSLKSCQRNASDDVNASCDPDAARKPSLVHAATDPPAPADIPISHRNGPAVGAPESTVLVASTPPLREDASRSTDAAPSSTKPRKAVRHQGNRRYSYEGSSFWPFDNRYRRGDYGRQRPRTLFW